MNQIIIINEIFQIEKINKLKIPDIQIFALNYEVHKSLEKKGIKHIIADKMLLENQRDKLFDFTTKKYKWFEENNLSKNFCYKKINLFEILNTGIFHENLIKILIEGKIIDKIIEEHKPDSIYCSNEIVNFIKINFKNIDTIEISNEFEESVLYENINFRFNIGSRSVFFNLSINNYQKLKKVIEKITYSIFNFWYKKSSKKIILFTEFNVINFKKLISELKNDYQLVFLNITRPAIWNFESMKILKKSNSKILDITKISNNQEIKNDIDKFQKELNQIFKEQEFYDIFKISGITFWPLIKGKMRKLYLKRIPNYIKEIESIKNIIKNMDVEYLICSNESGEAERILLKNNKHQFKSILLQHGFSNFHRETDEMRMRIDERKLNPIMSDKFFIWGENDKEFFHKLGLEKSKIVVTGSSRFDDYQVNGKNKNDKKIILITPEPIVEFIGHYGTELGDKYENAIKKIHQILKNYKDFKIIVKLHPGQNNHNKILKNIFNEIDKTIPIFQMKSSYELINQCDLLINITCEAVDPSTVMLEGLILEKPVLEISLDEKNYGKSNTAITSIPYTGDLKKQIEKILFDNEFQKMNQNNRKNILNNYLSYKRKSSEKILDYIQKWK